MADSLLKNGIAAKLTRAIIKEMDNQKCKMTFDNVDTDGSDIVFDACMKQGGKEAPYAWNSMLKAIFAEAAETWHKEGYGVNIKVKGEGEQTQEVRYNHAFWADNL